MTPSMDQAVYDFPLFLAEAASSARAIPFSRVKAEKVAVIGMGGSAIGGDLAAAVGEKTFSLPFTVIRHEEIPRHVNEKTLVLAVSYSGNTDETLSCLKLVLSQNPAHLIGISTGGILKQEAFKNSFPCVEIPGGLMPRAALPLTLVPLLFILHKTVGFPDPAADLEESIALLKKMREALTRPENPAKQLAKKLRGKLPILYAPTPSFAPAAKRWKCQINENAKQPAYFDAFPEAAHNEIVGYTEKLPVHQIFSVLFLRDKEESGGIQKKIEFFNGLVLKAGIEANHIHSQGKSFLARLLSLCYFGDYTSLYLAHENGVDPMPIAVIDALKKESLKL